MSRLTYLVVLCLALLFMNSCNKTPKQILLSGDEWLTKSPNDSVESSNNQLIKFDDSITISVGNTSRYNISWINGHSFILKKVENQVIFNIENLSKDKFKVAVLYEKEKLPVSKEDWDKLASESRVVCLMRKPILKGKPEVFKICGQDIPANKVPPAGTYILKGYYGDVMGVVKVIINKGNVKFYIGENMNSLKPTLIDTYDSTGYFSLKDFMSGSYEGNGLLRFNNGAMGVDEGQQYDNYILETRTNNVSSCNIFNQAINNAMVIGQIFKGCETSGKLIIKQFKHNRNSNGLTFDIPTGKMWTPLYFEYSNNCEYITIPRIFTERLSSSGWERASSYLFPQKKDFVSWKVSARNNKALSGEIAVMFYEEEYCEEVTYTFYFLEE